MTRSEIYVALQNLLAGERAVDAFEAAVDSLCALIMFMASDLAHADSMIDVTAEDMKRIVRINWDEVRTQFARAGKPGTA